MTSSVFCDRFLVFFSLLRVVAFVVGVSGRMNSTGNKFGNKIWGQFSSPTRSRSVRSTGLPFVHFPAGATVLSIVRSESDLLDLVLFFIHWWSRRTTVWFRPAIGSLLILHFPGTIANASSGRAREQQTPSHNRSSTTIVGDYAGVVSSFGGGTKAHHNKQTSSFLRQKTRQRSTSNYARKQNGFSTRTAFGLRIMVDHCPVEKAHKDFMSS
jgi:hypothetical protein